MAEVQTELNKQFLDEALRGLIFDVDTYLSRGVNVNSVDPSGRTALHLLASKGISSDFAIKKIIARGADINAQDANGNTPLISANLYGHDRTIKTLVAAGADDSIANKAGMRAGDYSGVLGYIERLKVFHGGDVAQLFHRMLDCALSRHVEPQDLFPYVGPMDEVTRKMDEACTRAQKSIFRSDVELAYVTILRCLSDGANPNQMNKRNVLNSMPLEIIHKMIDAGLVFSVFELVTWIGTKLYCHSYEATPLIEEYMASTNVTSISVWKYKRACDRQMAQACR